MIRVFKFQILRYIFLIKFRIRMKRNSHDDITSGSSGTYWRPQVGICLITLQKYSFWQVSGLHGFLQ